MRKRWKTGLRVVSRLLTATVALLAVLLAGVQLLGLRVYTVLSPSMEPQYPTGSLIYVKSVDPDDLQIGDVITFTLPGNSGTVTHRIVEILPDEDNPGRRCFRTQGDNNHHPDGGAVAEDRVVGTPIVMIPRLGYLAAVIRHPPGLYLAIAAAVCLMLAVLIIDIATDDSKHSERRTPHEQNPKNFAAFAVCGSDTDSIDDGNHGVFG